MLVSLFENNGQNQILIYLIFDDLNQKEKESIKYYVAKYEQNVIFIQISPERFQHFSISEHISFATYFRILIPEVIDSSIEKVLYLDTDIVVAQNIMELWNVDITNYHFAAIPEPTFNEHARLDIPFGAKYFNAGILLINLKKWREEKVSNQVLNFIDANAEKIIFWDQDALNAVLYNKWLALPLKWNQQSVFFEKEISNTRIDKTELREAIRNPSIIHFTGASKPWEYINFHPFKYKYFQYLKQTQWKTYTFRDKSLKNVLLKLVFKIMFMFGHSRNDTDKIIKSFKRNVLHISEFS